MEVPQVALRAGQPRGGARQLHPPWCGRTLEKESVVEVCGSCVVALLGFRSSPGVAEGQASVVGRVADADSSPFPHLSSGRPLAPSETQRKCLHV